MKNPWTSKNPFMSMWLSAFNRSAGMARGKATSEARRQVATAQANSLQQFLDLWTLQPARIPTTPRKKARH